MWSFLWESWSSWGYFIKERQPEFKFCNYWRHPKYSQLFSCISPPICHFICILVYATVRVIIRSMCHQSILQNSIKLILNCDCQWWKVKILWYAWSQGVIHQSSNVVYAPKLAKNLVSVGQLVEDTNSIFFLQMVVSYRTKNHWEDGLEGA